MPTQMDTLKDTTRETHARIERTAYAKSLAAGRPEVEHYVCHLRCLAVVHHYLEERLARAAGDGCALLRGLWSADRAKRDLLLEDMAHFEPALHPDNMEAMAVALGLAASLRDALDDRPGRLVGWFYVLEGSTNGMATIRRKLSEGLGIPEGRPGMLYQTNYGPGARARWSEFSETLNANFAQASETDREDAVEGARELMAAMRELFEALGRADAARAYCATTFNPESGTHPVPQDETVVRPAVRAGLRCLREFPTIRQRHGLRGERYTVADGLWLTTLAADFPAQAMLQQVDWLVGLLSARGLPSLLMERHLELLYAELMQNAPREQWENFLTVARTLRDRRLARLSAGEFDLQSRLTWEELQGRDPGLAALLSDFGHMVTGARADAENGLKQPERSLWDWAESRLGQGKEL